MSKDTGIELSPKHGVNPTLCTCFWCGEHIGVAMLGRIDKEDTQAPKEMVMDYEPCDACQAQRDKGTTIIAVTTAPVKATQPPITTKPLALYPQPKWLVMKGKPGTIALMAEPDFDKLLREQGIDPTKDTHYER